VRASADRIAGGGASDGDTAAGRLLPLRAGIATVEARLQPMSATLRTRVDELAMRARAVERTGFVVTGVLTIALVLVATAGAAVLARRIVRPVRDLLAGTNRVMTGDWSVRVREGRDEIGQLGASFNAMVGELRGYRERVEEYSATLEERVRQRTEELERKERALVESRKLASLGLLAAGVAHEINGPLTSIVMKSHLLIEELEAHPGAVEELRKIDGDAMRCQRIVENLRAFARRGELVMRRGRVADVVAHALAVTVPEIEPLGVQVVVELPADLPDVLWDPDRMAQVLTHLVLNAAHAMERGGTLTITARAGAGFLTLEVRDAGSGIPAAHLGRIFDPFFTTKANGTGLGLSISHGIVTEHRGRIDVASRFAGDDGVREDETGTTVTVVLPIGAEAATPA
jgi:two-component system NtrC family sensor kinase